MFADHNDYVNIDRVIGSCGAAAVSAAACSAAARSITVAADVVTVQLYFRVWHCWQVQMCQFSVSVTITWDIGDDIGGALRSMPFHYVFGQIGVPHVAGVPMHVWC